MEAIFLCLIFLVLRVSGSSERMFAFPFPSLSFLTWVHFFCVQLYGVDVCRIRLKIDGVTTLIDFDFLGSVWLRRS